MQCIHFVLSKYFTKCLVIWGISPLRNGTTLLLYLLIFHSGHSFAQQSESPINRLLASIQTPEPDGKNAFISKSVRVTDCGAYPYSDTDQSSGIKQLVNDLKAGLQQGLQCLEGQGPMGRLHAFHKYQSERLIELLEGPRTKTLQCVKDEMYAYAMAASSQLRMTEKDMDRDYKGSGGLTIRLDTYRIGGLLSQKFDEKTYKEFFKLNKEQIAQQLLGKPLRLEGVHRYENLSELLFHELVHWLGHTHSSIKPDLAFLYSTCCFGGSEYIEDDDINSDFQAQACNILKDDELWSANSYQKVRLWQYKGYDQLKREMRDYY